jgi:hypothetical protein
MTTGKIGGGQPVRRGAEAVEEAGGRQHERAGANRRRAAGATRPPDVWRARLKWGRVE